MVSEGEAGLEGEREGGRLMTMFEGRRGGRR